MYKKYLSNLELKNENAEMSEEQYEKHIDSLFESDKESDDLEDTNEAVHSRLFGKKEMRIIMLGLDGSGKTAILYNRKLGEDCCGIVVPTIGFNVESVHVGGKATFTLFDVGGQPKIRPLWRHYYEGISGLLFVVDSTDRERISEASEVLHKMLSQEIHPTVPVVVIANKQDLPDCMDQSEIASALNMHKLVPRKCYVQPASAKTGNGIAEALETLNKFVSNIK